MARNTRSRKAKPDNEAPGTVKVQQTRKRGESDPNEPPKRRKTRRSNNDGEVDEPEVDRGDRMVQRPAGKAKRAKKIARYVFSHLPTSFFCFN